MEQKIITRLSEDLAKEIASRNVCDVSDISVLIGVQVRFALRDIVDEYTTAEELEYQRLLEAQSKLRPHSQKYVMSGYKLALAKQKKAAANRAANNLKRQDACSILKEFISTEHGKEKVVELLEDN